MWFLDIEECSSKTSAQKLRARSYMWLMLFFSQGTFDFGADVQSRWADEFD